MRLEFTNLAGPRIARQRAEQEERERYAEKHERVAFGLNFVLVQLGLMTQDAWNRRHIPLMAGGRT